MSLPKPGILKKNPSLPNQDETVKMSLPKPGILKKNPSLPNQDETVKILVEGRIFRFDNKVLTSRAPCFVEKNARNGDKIVVSDFKADVIKDFLHYIRTGKIDDSDTTEKLYKFADCYCISDLQTDALKTMFPGMSVVRSLEKLKLTRHSKTYSNFDTFPIRENLNLNNFYRYFQFGKEFGVWQVDIIVSQFLEKNMSAAIKTDAWKKLPNEFRLKLLEKHADFMQNRIDTQQMVMNLFVEQNTSVTITGKKLPYTINIISNLRLAFKILPTTLYKSGEEIDRLNGFIAPHTKQSIMIDMDLDFVLVWYEPTNKTEISDCFKDPSHYCTKKIKLK